MVLTLNLVNLFVNMLLIINTLIILKSEQMCYLLLISLQNTHLY